jgi:glycosyltransferase involved in cell wall biosynthesis
MGILNSKPLVSIGVPIYNAERHIRQALDSLLAQDYDNFELIISDNASTDRTQEICQAYAKRDKRIQYYRNQANMGIGWNFNRVLELSSGEYFIWAAGDDYRDPRYIDSCLRAFGTSGDIVLVHSRIEAIDHETDEYILTDNGFSTIGLSRVEKFKHIARQNSRACCLIYGIFKSKALRKVMPFKKMLSFDALLLAELSLHGEFVTSPETLMFERLGGADPYRIKRFCNDPSNISNPFFRRYPFLGYFIHTQKIIFGTNRFNLMEKIRIAVYLTGDYIWLTILRATHKLLSILWPGAALRAREVWDRVELRKKRPGGAGIQYHHIVNKANSHVGTTDVISHT